MTKILNLLLIFSLLTMNLKAQDDVKIGKYKNFESKILGGKVTYLEHLPEGYEKSGKTYPVLFMMNGQNISLFANAVSTLDNLSTDRVPELILISISNTGVAEKYWSCPDESGFVTGENLSVFLKEELIPEITKNYRTNGYKILAGQSNTGLFVMYNFIHFPDLFNAYILASPMFGWCPDFFLNNIKSILKDHPQNRTKLHISYGDLDYIEVLKPINDIIEALKQSSANLEWKVEMIENSGHVPSAFLNNAILHFFAGCTFTPERKKMSVSEIKTHFEILSREYGFEVNPKAGALFDLTIDLANDGKTEQAIELNKYLVSLYPDSEIYFYYLGKLYLKKGETELARQNFIQATKINPDFDAAKNELDSL